MRILPCLLLFLGLSSALADPLLGQTPVQVAEVLGQPKADVKDPSGAVLGQIYCVGGQYLSNFYQPEGKTLSLYTPLKAYTVGACSGDPISPVTLYARFENGRLALAAYMTAYATTVDTGWMQFLDGLIADDPTFALEQHGTPSSQGPQIYTAEGTQYANGLARVRFFALEPSDFVGVAWYAAGVGARAESDPLAVYMRGDYLKQTGN